MEKKFHLHYYINKVINNEIVMFESCLDKQQAIKEIFLACPTEEAKYEKIIELGQKQKPLAMEDKIQQKISSRDVKARSIYTRCGKKKS